MVNVARDFHPFFFFGEAFGMDADYNTTSFLVDQGGRINYADDEEARAHARELQLQWGVALGRRDIGEEGPPGQDCAAKPVAERALLQSAPLQTAVHGVGTQRLEPMCISSAGPLQSCV